MAMDSGISIRWVVVVVVVVGLGGGGSGDGDIGFGVRSGSSSRGGGSEIRWGERTIYTKRERHHHLPTI